MLISGQNGIFQSLRRVAGVASLALRASLRTKTVLALLALLTVCVLALPGVVKGDGTPEGALHILLTYTLGFAFGILCLATMWAACALFAAEIDSSRQQLSSVKPVRSLEFWAGKWLALLVLNAGLLLAVYAGVYAQVQWQSHRQGWEAWERPACRRVTRPILPSPEDEARQTLAQMREQKSAPEGLSERSILRVLEAKAIEKYDVINPGEQVAWRFRLNRPLRAGEPVTVRIRFDTEFSTREQVSGICRLRCLDTAAPPVDVELNDFTQHELEFVVDSRAFLPEGASAFGADGVRSFEMGFRHAGDPKRAAGLMLRFRQDVALLTPGGSFESNLLRSAFVQWGVLALLAAFGLTLSACFSLPVAAFTATVLLALTLVGNSVVQVATEEDEKKWSTRVGVWVSRGVNEVSQHAMQAQPLVALTRGERLESRDLASAALWNVGLLPLLFAGAGCWVLRRRELADTD